MANNSKLPDDKYFTHGSVFPVFSMDRSVIHWEDYLETLTPVQQKGEMFFKREDMFAPLGYGGINGSKLRQAIFLLHEDRKRNPHHDILISGTSVKSPQTCFPGDQKLLLSSGESVSFEEAFISGEKLEVFTHKGNGDLGTACIDPPFLTKTTSDLYEIELEDGTTIKCTPDHPISTKRGFVEAQYLTEDDEVVTFHGISNKLREFDVDGKN